ncbi:14989_t:CDS:2, partial [Cetraspora pellucida]
MPGPSSIKRSSIPNQSFERSQEPEEIVTFMQTEQYIDINQNNTILTSSSLNIDFRVTEEDRSSVSTLSTPFVSSVSAQARNLKACIYPWSPRVNLPDSDRVNQLISEEQSYDIDELTAIVDNGVPQLNVDQKAIFSKVILAIDNSLPTVLFVDGPGGTGKTFLY